MRLLVTRSEPDAAQTAERLQDLGHEVFVEPLLTVEIVASPALHTRPAALLATSRNAIRSLATWPEAAAWRETPLLVVGDGTAATAREAGFVEVHSAQGAADDLVRLVTSRLDPIAGPILFAAAEVRSGDVNVKLRRAGFDVVLVEAYRTAPAGHLSQTLLHRITAGWLEGALFFSERTSATFGSLIGALSPEGLRGVTAFALSEHVARPLLSLGFQRIAIALHPNESALIELIPPPQP